MNPLISVIIPTYCRDRDLAQCLETLAPGKQTLSSGLYEVIVSDDARSPETRAMIEQRFHWARWSPGPQNGPAANRNFGAAQANGEWLAFTDDDCLPQNGWLGAFFDHIRDYDVLEGMTSASGIRNRVDDECPLNETGGYLWSCNFALKKAIFDEMGGFDEEFPAAAMEDVELNTRINKHGYSRTFVPDALILHPWRPEKGTDFRRKHAKSIAYYARKHPETFSDFTFMRMSLNLSRFILKSFLSNTMRYRGRGAINSIRNRMALILFTQLELKCLTAQERNRQCQ